MDAAVTTWIAILTVAGVLGVAGWVTTIWAVRSGRSWAHVVATVLLASVPPWHCPRC